MAGLSVDISTSGSTMGSGATAESASGRWISISELRRIVPAMESYEVDCRARDKRRVAPCSREEKQERGCIKAAISSSGVIADKSDKDSEKRTGRTKRIVIVLLRKKSFSRKYNSESNPRRGRAAYIKDDSKSVSISQWSAEVTVLRFRIEPELVMFRG